MGALLIHGASDDPIAIWGPRAMKKGGPAEAEHQEILSRPLRDGSAVVPFGALRGKIRIAPDFDETPPDLIDAMERGDP